MHGKLIVTFLTNLNQETFINYLTSNYTILYNKVYILKLEDTNEIVCSYNLDVNNTTNIPENSVFVHRKKETNTLYTINALNLLIAELNNKNLNLDYKVDWNNYKNTLLLTQQGTLNKLKTKLIKTVETNTQNNYN